MGKILEINRYRNKFDDNGNRIYFKDSNGYEEWYNYDFNNHLIHTKDSNGYE